MFIKINDLQKKSDQVCLFSLYSRCACWSAKFHMGLVFCRNSDDQVWRQYVMRLVFEIFLTTVFMLTIMIWDTVYHWCFLGSCNSPFSQIPQCIRQISHNAPLCSKNVHTSVHISVTKWCIVGYETGALWNLSDRCIVCCCLLQNTAWPNADSD